MNEMKVKLASALSLQPLGAIAMADLAKLYRQVNKEKLDFKGLGFESLQTLLESMPETVQVKYDRKSSDYRVFLINYDVNAAIEREFDNQSQSTSSLDESYSTKRYEKCGDWQRESFVDRTGTREDRPVNRLREKPIPTAFRGQNDWDLYLNNFPNDTTESDLMDILKPLKCTRIRIKKRENETLFGFATFREYSDAEEAYLTLDLTEFRGRRLNIQFAKSSIASEDEVRMRLEKTQFTTEVNSSRHRRFPPDDDDGSVDRRATTQPDHLNWSRSGSQLDPHCHSPLRKDDSSRQPFSAPGYITIGDETTTRRVEDITSSDANGIATSNTNQKKIPEGWTSCANGYSTSGIEGLYCDRRRKIQSNSKRTVQVFTDVEVDGAHNSEDDTEATADVIAEREEGKTGKFDPWAKQNNPGQRHSSPSNENTSSNKTVQTSADTNIGRKQSNSIESNSKESDSKESNPKESSKSLDKDRTENSDNEEQLDPVESVKKTKVTGGFSVGETPQSLESSTNSRPKLRGTVENLSTDSHELRSGVKIQNKVVANSTTNPDFNADISKDIQNGQRKNKLRLLNTNGVSSTSLSETQSDLSFSSDTDGAMIEKSDITSVKPRASEGKDSCKSICRGDLETKLYSIENKALEENSPVRSQALKTARDIAPKWLRVYVREYIYLVENALRWTKIYSRNEMHLGQLKYQCRPLTQSNISSLPEYPLSDNSANSSKVKTETVASDSLSAEVDTTSTSKTLITQVDSMVGKCCEKIPETMEFPFLQTMLNDTRLDHGFLSQMDLPDKLDLIVIHVCNSNHFWGSVVNPGAFIDEYEDLFQMMNDIAIKARPEFRLDKASAEDKRAGVMYQDTDWCRVWIRSEVRNSEVEVFYVDYGNSEFRSTNDLFVLPRKAWNLRPMVLPFHLTGFLAKKTLSELINTKITVKLIRSQPSEQDYVVAVRPYKELD